MNKRITAIGLTAGLLAGAGAGLILEMSGSAGAASNPAVVTVAPDDSAPDDSSNPTDAANPTADAAGDHTARLTEVLQPLVADGTLTQAQLDSVISALESAGPMGGPGGDRGGPAGDHGGRGMGPGKALDAVAGVLDMTADEVRTAIEGGQTLAQLAEAKGSSGQAVIDALVAEMKAHFDEEVASGEHTQADADARLAEATTRITDMVNNTKPGGPEGPGGPGGPGRGHGPGGAHGDMHGDGAGNGSGAPGTDGAIDGGPADTPTNAGA